MNRSSIATGLAWLLGPLTLAGPIAGPLRVTIVVAPGPHYVGQAIEVQVQVEGSPESPSVEAPRVAGAEVRHLRQDRARPSAARFLIIPGHPGVLDVPPFRARSGDRSGASRSTRLTVVNVPAEGRTAAFLGGVGPFEVRAEAEPLSVRLGQTLEYRVHISGDAAWGSARPPDLGEHTKHALRVESLTDAFDDAVTPIRTFRFRLRPSRSGRVVLPPVAVASFDPKTRRYTTKATSSLSIRVEEPPRFDPARLDYEHATPPGPRPLTIGLWTFAGSSAFGLILWFRSVRRRKARPADPRRLALELSRGLGGCDDEVEAARAVSEALTGFLQRVDGRTPGVLTPVEARAWFGRVTDDETLASLAQELVSRCDRARYGAGGDEAKELLAEGRRFFEGIAGVLARESSRGGGPREAVETA